MSEKQSYFIYVFAMFVFGTIGPFVREIPLSSGLLAFFRGALGSVFLILLTIFLKRKINWGAMKKNFWLLFFSGAAVGINWILFFESIRYTTIANATLSYYFAPVFMMLAASFLLKEPFTLKKVLSLVAAVLGMFCIMGVDSSGTNNMLGIGLGLVAAVFYAFVVIINKYIKGLSGLETTLAQLMIATIAMLPYALATNTATAEDFTVKTIVFVIYVGFINTGLAYFLYFTGMQGLKAQTIAINSYIDPVTAIIISTVVLGEVMTPIQMFGGLLILGSTLLGEVLKIKKPHCKPN